ncbi:MAG TPA: 4a-hydroxytetrahydrobiopterin dehydratase [Opitutaceae bacterium]|nr:4a-hydroxytetrahydrobiopterin dehydratase [Opitutaceae bacterium]
MPSLDTKQIQRRLKLLPEWSRRGRAIRRRFSFAGFMGSVEFVNRIARQAERANHHPDIDIRWNRVTLALTTHDKGGLTGKDFAMARKCDEAFSRLAKAR